jgi:RNA polymerase sigma factor (sigma-70 family)
MIGKNAAVSRGPRRPPREATGSGRSVIDRYLADIRHYPRLTREEELELVSQAQEGSMEALDWLIECNLRFVVRVAGEYRNRGLPFEDLINEGNLGLIEAARRYDPGQGTRFISWAVWWIRKSIRAALAEQPHVVRLPLSQFKKIRVVRATEKALEGELGRGPTLSEMSASLPVGLSGMDPIHHYGIRCASLDEPVHREGRRTMAEVVGDDGRPSVEEQMLDREQKSGVRALQGQLDGQQREVIAGRFGLDGQPPQTLAEIGQRIGRSREGVRLIEVRALQRLRRLLAATDSRRGRTGSAGQLSAR